MTGLILSHWLYLVVIIIAFPPFEGLLAFVLLPRLLQLLRLARLGNVVMRGLVAVRHVFIRQGLVYLFSITIFVVFGAAGLLTLVEPQTVDGNFWDAAWWSVVTVTTVGYGDIVPTSVPGRLIGALVMLVGLGTVSALAGAVAAYFVGQDDPKQSALARPQAKQLADLEGRLASLETLLQDIDAAQRRIEALLEQSVAADGRSPTDGAGHPR